jgi:hypothetical protein
MILEFDKFYKENSILIECMLLYSSYLHQPLDIGYFSVLKQIYSDLVRGKIGVGVYYIDKLLFLELFSKAYTKTFSLKNIKSSFIAIGLVLLDLG